MDASNMLKPALARGELRAIGATTLDEYQKHIEKDAALERRFQPVYVEEPTVEDTIAILRGLQERYEIHHGVRITDAALVAAARLSHRYITDRFLPDKAIDLVDEAAARLRTEIDSMPAEIDAVERRIVSLEIEKRALAEGEDQGGEGAPRGDREAARRGARGVQRACAPSGRPRRTSSRRSARSRRRSRRSSRRPPRPSAQGELQKVAELRYGRLPAAREGARRRERAPGGAAEGPADAARGGHRGGHRRGRLASGRASRSTG